MLLCLQWRLSWGLTNFRYEACSTACPSAVLIEPQQAASSVMSPQAGAYYHTASLDGISHEANRSSFRKCRIVPRVLRDVSVVYPQTEIFGIPSALPIYISPSSNAVLGHPDGELNLTRGVRPFMIIGD